MNNEIIYNQNGKLMDDVSNIIESSQRYAYHAVDSILVLRNWLLGKRIATENMGGTGSERYGAEIIATLSENLTEKYGKGFDKSSLYRYVKFYQNFPEIVATVSPQSFDVSKVGMRGGLLSWSHYRVLLQVEDEIARKWYEKEAYEQTWSVRTLQRNVNTQYYDRMLLTTNKPAVEAEMKELTSEYQRN